MITIMHALLSCLLYCIADKRAEITIFFSPTALSCEFLCTLYPIMLKVS